ncbi:hypothetical protein C7474_1224 [Microbacterium telephonicum]|uniref:General stress protein 17M-like domain-containing protein n=2 Tax=Microbacterium telephonicum TaxID=1714841 RepID=A0A498C9W3_9MICO|nr:hypothetical protein C7474_1224 [Microbacterium telephonicum]
MIGGAPQEHGEKIADFPSYPAAQKAVTRLIEADIPAKDIAIVGRGIRSVETITGRLGYGAAARSGAINGILLGLLFSALFVLGTPGAAVQLFAGVMLVGIALGMLMSLIVYAFLRRKRDYSSITQLIADHYEVTVLPRSIHRAREVVGGRVGPAAAAPVAAPQQTPAPAPAPAPQPAPPLDAEPPRYGERIDPTPGDTPPAS